MKARNPENVGLWVIPLGILASLVAGALIVRDYPGLIDVFEFADPTDGFGAYFHLGGLLQNLVVIFILLCILLHRSQSRFGLACAVTVFIPPLLAAITALPCFLAAHPGALCGVGAVLVLELGIPVVVVAGVAFTATSASSIVKFTGAGVAVAFLAFVGAAKAQLSPLEPEQCRSLAELTRRSNCLRVFAERRADENICRSIGFRTTRFTCLREVALAKHQPRLCTEIDDTAPIAAYEAPAVFYRDTCFQNMAYALHDRSQCADVADPRLRRGCEQGVR